MNHGGGQQVARVVAELHRAHAPSRRQRGEGNVHVQVAADTVPLQVLPVLAVKSRLGAPCVSTLMVPKVVVDATLYGNVMVSLHGAGVLCPVGQTLMLPKFTARCCTSTTWAFP